MADEAGVEYSFTCPACEETLVVNGAMRETLIEQGCVICSASLTAAAFSERESDPAN
jgi:transcription elongation factor Elf1